jgi:type I restriction enzyme S subunit
MIGLYLFYYLKSEVFAIDIKNQINTNTQGNVGIQNLKKVKLILPPIEEQNKIVEYIENITQKIASAISLKEQEIDKLKEYKASLINGVVTGKVKIC